MMVFPNLTIFHSSCPCVRQTAAKPLNQAISLSVKLYCFTSVFLLQNGRFSHLKTSISKTARNFNHYLLKKRFYFSLGKNRSKESTLFAHNLFPALVDTPHRSPSPISKPLDFSGIAPFLRPFRRRLVVQMHEISPTNLVKTHTKKWRILGKYGLTNIGLYYIMTPYSSCAIGLAAPFSHCLVGKHQVSQLESIRLWNVPKYFCGKEENDYEEVHRSRDEGSGLRR